MATFVNYDFYLWLARDSYLMNNNMASVIHSLIIAQLDYNHTIYS